MNSMRKSASFFSLRWKVNIKKWYKQCYSLHPLLTPHPPPVWDPLIYEYFDFNFFSSTWEDLWFTNRQWPLVGWFKDESSNLTFLVLGAEPFSDRLLNRREGGNDLGTSFDNRVYLGRLGENLSYHFGRRRRWTLQKCSTILSRSSAAHLCCGDLCCGMRRWLVCLAEI